MNKLTTFAMLAVLALAFTFSSCENEDNQIARYLDGIWSGTISQEYCTWRGYKTVFQDAEIEFYKDPTIFGEGEGVEYDYDITGRSYVENRFIFHVRNRRIFLDYQYGQDVVIEEYSLDGNRFNGIFRRWYNNDHDEWRTYSSWYIGEELARFEFYRINNWRYNDRYIRQDYWTRSTAGEQGKSWTLIENPLKQ